MGVVVEVEVLVEVEEVVEVKMVVEVEEANIIRFPSPNSLESGLKNSSLCGRLCVFIQQSRQCS